jgi:transposase-like protein
MGRRLDEGKWKLWERRLAEFRANGSTVTQFCQDEDVSPKTFYYWMRRLNANTTRSKAPGSAKPRGRRAAVPHARAFVPALALAPPHRGEHRSERIEVRFGRHTRASIPAHCLAALQCVMSTAFESQIRQVATLRSDLATSR